MRIFALVAFFASAAGASPLVSVHIAPNESFVFPDGHLDYVVVASEDSADTLAGTLDPNRTAVTVSYVEPGGEPQAPKPVDPRTLLGALRGRALIAQNDCVVCHFEASSVPQAIPTYTQIATRFMGNLAAAAALVVKIHNGSQHAWGEIPMPGHPDLSDADATAIAYYILSFANDDRQQFLPLSGELSVPLAEHRVRDRFGTHWDGKFVLTASYSGSDADGFGSTMHALRDANVAAVSFDDAEDVQTVTLDGAELVAPKGTQGRLVFKGIDLSGITAITVRGLGSSEQWTGGRVELRLDSPRGQRLGDGRLDYDAATPTVGEVVVRITPVSGRHDLYVVLRGKIAVARLCFACER